VVPHPYSVPRPRSYLYTYSLLFLNFINSHFPVHSHTASNSLTIFSKIVYSFNLFLLLTHERRNSINYKIWRVRIFHHPRWTHLVRPWGSLWAQPSSWSSSSAWVVSSLAAITGTSSKHSEILSLKTNPMILSLISNLHPQNLTP